MKFDAQTLILLALVAFVFMQQQKKEEKEQPLLSDDTLKTIAALLKAVTGLKTNVTELQKRIDDLHSVSPVGGY